MTHTARHTPAGGGQVSAASGWSLLLLPSNSFHACPAALQDQWLVRDTSTNGTFINGIKIGKDKTAVLRPGDRLGLSINVPTNTANHINSVE